MKTRDEAIKAIQTRLQNYWNDIKGNRFFDKDSKAELEKLMPVVANLDKVGYENTKDLIVFLFRQSSYAGMSDARNLREKLQDCIIDIAIKNKHGKSVEDLCDDAYFEKHPVTPGAVGMGEALNPDTRIKEGREILIEQIRQKVMPFPEPEPDSAKDLHNRL